MSRNLQIIGLFSCAMLFTTGWDPPRQCDCAKPGTEAIL